jgi:biotin carboxylase
MSRIFVLCATVRDRRELALLGAGHEYVFHDYATAALEDMIGSEVGPAADLADPLDEIEAICAALAHAPVDGIISTDDYPGAALAAIVAARFGLASPAPAVNLLCQHKYESRRAQARFAPHAVPEFQAVDVVEETCPALAYPAFVKPMKSFFSIGAERLDGEARLRAIKRRWRGHDDFFAPFERLLVRHAGLAIGSKRLIVEGLLEGVQVTVEGYVQAGVPVILGVVDSVMFPGTLSFARFEYPSSLAHCVQARMGEIARVVMSGMGYDNGMFNIEMMYDPDADRVFIIEINPRMASQFADLYEKVDGINTYGVLTDIALGRSVRFEQGRGRHAMAASCVLRVFADRFVERVPDACDLAKLAQAFPDARAEILARAGHRLSDEMQDGGSYRYGLVNLGGTGRDAILADFARATALLDFRFREPGPARDEGFVG